MQSKISFFNKTVFWSDERRFWPLTAGFTLIWLLILPITRFTELNHDPDLSIYNVQRDTLGVAANTGYWMAFFFGIFFAMAAFSYLTNPRATNGLHALSARRETLYVTHALAGLCAQLAAEVLALLLTALVLAGRGALDVRTIGLSLLALVLPTIFFYAFGVFCMMFTGQILAAPVFYGILNIVVVGAEFLLRLFAGNFLYGWSEDSTPVLLALSPIVKMVSVVGVGRNYTYAVAGGGVAQEITGMVLRGLDWLWIYAAVGLIFAALGLFVYRTRHSEATGEVVAIAWAKPVFKYGVTACTALALGQLFYEIFFGRYQSNGSYSLPGTLACMAAAGLIGYFIAEMLLKKSFRVWKDGWRGAAIVTVLLVLLGVGMSLDLTGYEGRVPDAGEVKTVYANWNSFYGSSTDCSVTLEDDESIRLVTEAHRALVRDKKRQLELAAQDGNGSVYDPEVGMLSSTRGFFYVRYTLKNGRTETRRYDDVTLFSGELNDTASPAAAMTAFYNARSVAKLRAIGSRDGMYYSAPRAYDDLRFTGGTVSISRWDDTGTYQLDDDAVAGYLGDDQFELSPSQAQALYDAVLRDVEAGRVNDSLFDGSVIGGNDLSVELYATYLAPRTEDGATAPNTDHGRMNASFFPQITPKMTEALAALRAAGVK